MTGVMGWPCATTAEPLMAEWWELLRCAPEGSLLYRTTLRWPVLPPSLFAPQFHRQEVQEGAVPIGPGIAKGPRCPYPP